MAALREIARCYADEIREGIAWVIIWKIGRSWNATAVWLNCDTNTFEPHDYATAHEALECDPNAIMINGYYCGHFGEDMSVSELIVGIRWHYEHGYNLLKDSLAFPEPQERPAELPNDMPWYELPYPHEPEPFIYDCHMTPEDYRHMNELEDEAKEVEANYA